VSERRGPIERLKDQVFLVFLFACVVTLGAAIVIDRLERRVEQLESREGE
jgi:hypothetical protein